MSKVWIPAPMKRAQPETPPTISQLIEKLNEIMNVEGDLPVYFYDGELEDVPATFLEVLGGGKWSTFMNGMIDGRFVRIDNHDTYF